MWNLKSVYYKLVVQKTKKNQLTPVVGVRAFRVLMIQKVVTHTHTLDKCYSYSTSGFDFFSAWPPSAFAAAFRFRSPLGMALLTWWAIPITLTFSYNTWNATYRILHALQKCSYALVHNSSFVRKCAE